MSRRAARQIEVDGRYRIDAGLDAAWRELNNPDALAYSIRQCQRMERLSAQRFRAHFPVGVGPLKVPVAADLNVVDEDPPHRYRLICRLSMKLLGDAEGVADMELAGDDQGVCLTCRARVSVSGRIAGRGIEYLQGAVERNIESFFTRFSEWMTHGGNPCAHS